MLNEKGLEAAINAYAKDHWTDGPQAGDDETIRSIIATYLANLPQPEPVEGPLVEQAHDAGIRAAAAVNERVQAGENIAPDEPYHAAVDAVISLFTRTVEGVPESLIYVAPRKTEHFRGYEEGWRSAALHILNRLREGVAVETETPAPPAQGWRPEVRAFADLMEAQLRANDHKPGWKNERTLPLFSRLLDEVAELGRQFYYEDDFDAECVGPEAADIGNFAMMIADVCGALSETPAPPAQEWRPDIERAIAIVTLFYGPWGAAKAAMWEDLTGDKPFLPGVALDLIKEALLPPAPAGETEAG